MCGICGIVDHRAGAERHRETIRSMSALIAHRGPDHEGIRVDGACALGHRRLAITDLVTGQQPLGNEDGTVWVVFNGEIYNYKALRRELEARGHRFTTETDTEVIPHLYEEHGDLFMTRMEGNWAIGLWDERRSRLLLSRDRIGKKPLVWTSAPGGIRFASEAKALVAGPDARREPSMDGLLDVLTYGYVTETHTMFEGVHAVLPATTLVFEQGATDPVEIRYWDFAAVAPYDRSLEDAQDEFAAILSDVTRDRLIGDVPYGLMLSGGIDSTLVASFIVEHEPSLKTYTVAREGRADETAAAAAMARHIGAEHHVVGLEEIDPVAVGARIPWMFDQPFFNDASFAQLCGGTGDHRRADGRHHRGWRRSRVLGHIRHLGENIAARWAGAGSALAAASAGSSMGTRLAGPGRASAGRDQIMRVARTGRIGDGSRCTSRTSRSATPSCSARWASTRPGAATQSATRSGTTQRARRTITSTACSTPS